MTAILFIAGGAIVLCLLLMSFGFLLLRAQFRANPAYRESLAIARSSPAVQALLGGQIDEGWMTFAEMRVVYGSDFAEWTAAIKGPKGRGWLHGVANRIGAYWHYSRVTVTLDRSEKLVDLTPSPVRDPLLLGESKKKVFLVPLGPLPAADLDWAPAYYQAKFGLTVGVLPAIPLPASALDAKRNQLVAENLIALLKKALPEQLKDQSAIVIGVTSRDMYIQSYNWRYAINYREDGRFAVVSAARLRPFVFFQKWNPALEVSRLKKMITKNVYLECFDAPMSSDYTSAVSGGVMSPEEVDYMSDQIIGAEGRWHSLVNSDEPTVSLTFAPGQDVAWNMDASPKPPVDVSSRYFEADLKIGLLIQRKTDFYLTGDSPLQFVRVYRNEDNESRGFGIGTNDSLDIFLEGEPNKYIQVALEDGARVQFNRDIPHDQGLSQSYTSGPYNGRVFSFATLLLKGFDSDIQNASGWHFLFPYRGTAKAESKLVALTGYSDPQGRRYEMVRNAAGDLLSITTPAGKWLHFSSDEQHRFRRIEASDGRVVDYSYDPEGRLIRASDSTGNAEIYRYDEKNRMRAVLDGNQKVVISFSFSADGEIESETLADGRSFHYEYQRDAKRNLAQIRLTDPRGFVTLFNYRGGNYTQTLPSKSADPNQVAPEPFLE